MNMKTIRNIRSVLIVLAVICAGSLTSCNEDQVKKAKQASQRIERAVGAALELIPAFRQEGLFDEGEEAHLTALLTDVKSAIGEFNRRAANYKSFDATAKTDLWNALVDVTAALAKLNEEGVLRFKNPKVKGRVQIALTAANLAAQEIADALNQTAQ